MCPSPRVNLANWGVPAVNFSCVVVDKFGMDSQFQQVHPSILQTRQEARERQELFDAMAVEDHQIKLRRERRESFVAYGSLSVAILSLLLALVALCRPIHLNHHYTVTIPEFPTLECCERCGDNGQQNGN